MVRPMNEITALLALVRTDFFYFVWKCFDTIVQEKQFVANWHIKAVAHELMRTQRGETTRLIINQPPRSLKSICVSVAYVAWLLGHDPRRRIIVVSYSNELAAELHRQFRMVIDSEWYKQAFPMMRLAKDAGLETVTTVGGGRYATSVEGTLTGRGANLIIIDDPQKADEAQSEKVRAQVLNWFRGTLLTRLDDKRFGQIILVMQRLHPDDLSGDLLVTGDWCHLNLPSVALEDRTIQIGDNKFIRWPRGEPLQLEREGLEILDRIKRAIGSQKYSAQFLQQPVPEGGNAIKGEWFRCWTKTAVKQSGDLIVQSWDVAAAIGDNNDYSVCTTWLKRKGDYYLLDVFRDRLAYPDLRRKIRTLAREFGADTVLIEKAGIGLSLLQELENDLPSGMVRPIGIVPKGDKKDRLAAQSARIEAGHVYLPTEAAWLADFLFEILAFPNSRHDDQVDSLSQFLYWASHPRFETPIKIGLPIYD
jgi:predicted phage terminase large subunit-like protein